MNLIIGAAVKHSSICDVNSRVILREPTIMYCAVLLRRCAYPTSPSDPAEPPGPCRWSPSPAMLSPPWEGQKLHPKVTVYLCWDVQSEYWHISVFICILLNVILVDVEENFLLLGASGFEQLHQLIQINAAFSLVQVGPPTFELICGDKKQKTHPQILSFGYWLALPDSEVHKGHRFIREDKRRWDKIILHSSHDGDIYEASKHFTAKQWHYYHFGGLWWGSTHSCGWPSAPASSWLRLSPGSSGRWCLLWPDGTPPLVWFVRSDDSGPEPAGLPGGSEKIGRRYYTLAGNPAWIVGMDGSFKKKKKQRIKNDPRHHLVWWGFSAWFAEVLYL